MIKYWCWDLVWTFYFLNIETWKGGQKFGDCVYLWLEFKSKFRMMKYGSGCLWQTHGENLPLKIGLQGRVTINFISHSQIYYFFYVRLGFITFHHALQQSTLWWTALSITTLHRSPISSWMVRTITWSHYVHIVPILVLLVSNLGI